MTVTLEQVVPWGRTLSEYTRMFSLTEQDLRGQILGSGDGPASFNAELNAAGGNVTSCDPIYAFSADRIAARVEATYPVIIDQVTKTAEDYVWGEFADPAALGATRMTAMRRFIADYQAAPEGRYIAAALPDFPFPDQTFDLALCSHFLFLYSEHFSLEFHVAALREMLRIAREVRVFPLLGLDCLTSPHLEPARAQLTAEGFSATVETVNYEFQRGGNQMLRLRA
jgi:hypothetical protein